MKKYLLLFVSIVLFNSCSRDLEDKDKEIPQINTKKFLKSYSRTPTNKFTYDYSNQKLSKVTFQDGNVKTFFNVYYNAKNQLENLYFESPSDVYNTTFTYSGSQLVGLQKQIVGKTTPLIADFIYNSAGKLSKIKVKYPSGRIGEADITYGDNSMSVKYDGSSVYVYSYDTKTNPLINVDKNIILAALVVQTQEIFADYLVLENNMIKEVHENAILMQFQYEYEADGFPSKQIDVLNNEVFLYEYVNL